jgi:hypothetical protein
MAEKKFKATIEIGGAVAGSLKSSFAAVTGNTKILGKTVNALNAQMKTVRAEMKKSGADTGALGKQLAELEKRAASTKRVLEGYNKLGDLKIGDKLGTAVRRAGAGFLALGAAAGAASAAVWKFGAGFGAFADEAAEASSNIGVGTNFLLGVRFAAEQTGASAELADRALMEMVKRLQDAEEEGNATGDAMRMLGIDVAQIQSMDAASQFATIAEAFSKMPESAAKTAAAFEIFGKAGRKLPNLLNLGKDGLNAKLEAAKAAGYLLSEADKAMGDAFDEAMGEFKLAAQGAANTVGRELLPVLTDLAKEIGSFIRDQGPQLKSWAQDFGGWLKTNGPSIGTQIKDVALSLVQLARDAQPVIQSLGGVKFVIGAMAAAAFAPLIASVFSLSAVFVAALPAIVSITTGLWGMAAAGWAAMAPLLPIIGAVALVVGSLALLGWSIKTYVIDEWDTWKWAMDELWGKLSSFGTSVVEWVGTTSAAFADFGTGIYDSIVGAFDSVTARVSAWFDWIKGKLSSVGSSISGIFSGGAEPATPDGARAKGGPVRRGGSYLVGEQGPELFTPGASGSIIPNNRLGGSQSVDSRTYNITINAAPGMDERSLADLVLARLDGRQAALAGGALYD